MIYDGKKRSLYTHAPLHIILKITLQKLHQKSMEKNSHFFSQPKNGIQKVRVKEA